MLEPIKYADFINAYSFCTQMKNTEYDDLEIISVQDYKWTLDIQSLKENMNQYIVRNEPFNDCEMLLG